MAKLKHGSVAMRRRKRSRDITPRIFSWSYAGKGLQGFPAYKVGMTSIGMIDDSTSPSKGMEIAVPVTVLETPKITVFGIRAYKHTPKGDICLGDVVSASPKTLGRLGMKRETKHKGMDWLVKQMDQVSYLTALAITNPETAGIPKKKAEIVEIAIGGDKKEQLEYAKGIIGKDISIRDVFEDGEWADSIAVTKGKGWQGPIKRFGISKQRRKATGKIRHVGTLGPWHPSYVMYTAPQAGQLGFFRRTQYNVRILVLGEDPAKINPAGGFPYYGTVKTDYTIVRGSVQGPAKRFVFLRKGLRAKPTKKPQITWM